MPITLLRFKVVRYGIVGGTGGVASWLLFLLLTSVGMWYLYASSIAGWLTYALSFVLHKLWTFESKELYTTAWQLPAHLFLKLVWNALVVTPLFLYCLVEYLGWNALVAQPVAGACIGCVQNFLICTYVIFNPRLAHYASAKAISQPAV
jgi:putative flippase GtrA